MIRSKKSKGENSSHSVEEDFSNIENDAPEYNLSEKSLDTLQNSIEKLTLLRLAELSYADEAVNRMDCDFSKDWRNINKYKSYTKESESSRQLKLGDEAEEVLFRALSSEHLCQKLGKWRGN